MSNLKTEKGIGLILKNNDYSNKNHQQEEKNYEDKNLLCVADVILQALNEQTGKLEVTLHISEKEVIENICC